MNIEQFLKSEYYYSVVSIAATIISFLLFSIITNSGWLNNRLQIRFGEKYTKEYRVYIRQIAGFIFYGVLPFLVILLLLPHDIFAYGIEFSFGKKAIIYVIVLSFIIISMNFFASRGSENLKRYPLIRVKLWNIKLVVLSSLGWIIYLVAYEFMFRGFLLFACIRAYELWPAIFINITIYSVVHIPQGLKETIGAIPLGLILCYLTLSAGNIWPAVILHIVLAISNEWFSILNNPDISLKIFCSD